MDSRPSLVRVTVHVELLSSPRAWQRRAGHAPSSAECRSFGGRPRGIRALARRTNARTTRRENAILSGPERPTITRLIWLIAVGAAAAGTMLFSIRGVWPG